MTPSPLASPFADGEHTSRYVVRPRESRAFHTALDASDLFTSREAATVTWSLSGGVGELRVEMPVQSGNFDERCSFATTPALRPTSFTRSLHGPGGRALRQEHADFESVIPKLPAATYPETMLPFLLRAHPLDGERRSLYAWICDRFVAKVYYEVHKKHAHVRVPAGQFEAVEVVMYPDINDWVKLGSVVTKLVKPFLPKYHMWFQPTASGHHQLVRFEGPYGPPGAPEIILELA
ncbi:MAG TPA: hypothetical protein VLM85_27300 [Polyangiaceae bacterium]|nr:hypothetical protein [Polyangiaceae bacterium]